jgi:hypothetical protein
MHRSKASVCDTAFDHLVGGHLISAESPPGAGASKDPFQFHVDSDDPWQHIAGRRFRGGLCGGHQMLASRRASLRSVCFWANPPDRAIAR